MTNTSADTKARLVEAALATLETEGFARATSRTIARRAGVNQALVFYHFGSLDGLLLAALDATSDARLARYREAFAGVDSLDRLVALAAEVYREDRESGHMTVVAQMVAGSLARPELAPALVERMEPWVQFAEEIVGRVAARSPIGREDFPVGEAAYAIATFYLGLNLVTHLDRDERAEAVFARMEELGPRLALLFETASEPAPRPRGR